MKLYDIIDGGWLGLYQERAVMVYISDYRKVVESQWICEMVTERFQEPDRYVIVEKFFPPETKIIGIWIPETTEVRSRVVPGYFRTEIEVTPAHWGTRSVWLEPHTEVYTRTVPGRCEQKTETIPAHLGTREYWVDEEIETVYKFVGTAEQRSGRYGWEFIAGRYVFVGTAAQRAGRAGWESEEVVTPGYWKKRHYWVPITTRTYEVCEPDTTETYEVEVPGEWVDRRMWFPDVRREFKVWVPETSETYTVVVPGYTREVETEVPGYSRRVEIKIDGEWVTREHLVCGWKEVEIEQPVYSYYYPEYEYKVIDIKKGPELVLVGPPEGDVITLRTPVSKIEVEIEGNFLGLATRIDDNKYVLPVKRHEYPEEVEEF